MAEISTTALPIMETPRGVLKESLVLLHYLDETVGAPVARADAFEHGVENMLIALEGPFVTAGYRFLLNQDTAKRDALAADMAAHYQKLQDCLDWRNPDGVYLFENFGLAECVYASMFARFQFLDYYENWDVPDRDFARVKRWRAACLEHPAAQQASREEIIKSYYDYAIGVGNGGLVEGRSVSSFAFAPHWREPMAAARKMAKARGIGNWGWFSALRRRRMRERRNSGASRSDEPGTQGERGALRSPWIPDRASRIRNDGVRGVLNRRRRKPDIDPPRLHRYGCLAQ